MFKGKVGISDAFAKYGDDLSAIWGCIVNTFKNTDDLLAAIFHGYSDIWEFAWYFAIVQIKKLI